MHVDCVSTKPFLVIPPTNLVLIIQIGRRPFRPEHVSPLFPPTDYAKLIRKRDKQLGADGQPIRIDLETLRASTRAAGDKENSQQQATAQKSSNEVSPPSHSHSHSQSHTPGTQSVSASPTTVTMSKPSTHSSHPHPPTSAASSGPYSYSSLPSSAGAGTGSIPPPQSALSSGRVEPMPAGQPIWMNQTSRSYGGDQPPFLRASHTPAEPRSTST